MKSTLLRMTWQKVKKTSKAARITPFADSQRPWRAPYLSGPAKGFRFIIDFYLKINHNSIGVAFLKQEAGRNHEPE